MYLGGDFAVVSSCLIDHFEVNLLQEVGSGGGGGVWNSFVCVVGRGRKYHISRLGSDE